MTWHAQENGSALVVALVIMTVILSLGLLWIPLGLLRQTLGLP